MLTKNDIGILKEIFVTKEEFKQEMNVVKNDIKTLTVEIEEIKQTTKAILVEIRGMIETFGIYTHRTEVLEVQFQSHLANHKGH